MNEIVRINNINLKSLRDIILDHGVSEKDLILIHPNDFDDIAVDYRESYKASIEIPFFFLGVQIDTQDRGLIRSGNFKIERNGARSKMRYAQEENYPPFDVVYRCGWCGNVVGFDGSLLSESVRSENIRVLEKFKSDIRQISVDGACCPNGHED